MPGPPVRTPARRRSLEALRACGSTLDAVLWVGSRGGAMCSSTSCRCRGLAELPAGAVSWGPAAGSVGAQRAGGGAQRVARAYSWTAA
ncbi:hypothetical protein WME94_35585 [Sorangium sp. So ce429]